MIAIPKSAMVLAAGLGTRMRPITDTMPKPLVEVGGRTLLDHAIDRLEQAGVERVVVNLHYQAEHGRGASRGTARSPKIELSHEDGAARDGRRRRSARCRCSARRFFVVNADVLWLDGKDSALARLAARVRPRAMDAVLLLQRTAGAVGYDGSGDYFLDPLGMPRRRGEREIAPFLFTGMQLLHRRLFDGNAETALLAQPGLRPSRTGRPAAAIVHDGEWFHVGTPEGLARTRARFSSHRIER